jgi:hypothetical protein
VITDYLHTFFRELEETKSAGAGLSHAIVLENGSICVLIGMGDCRARVPVNTLDPDPQKAAECVMAKHNSMTHEQREKSLECCH